MKFRTEIEIKPFARRIDYGSHIFALGSCFAENMAERMLRAKFRITANPMGILFNPASIADALARFATDKLYSESDLTEHGDRWFSFDAHTSLDGSTMQEALQSLNGALDKGREALRKADWVILTFGTAWVYELAESGRVVANCHKMSQAMFRRRRLSAEEIVAMYEPLIGQGILHDKQILLTVSPVRHLADGLDGNAVSKAVLRLAAEELALQYDNVHYFPSYEITTDDLRDYRFYAEDLVHPSQQAVEYIWEKFADALLTDEAKALLPRVEQIVAAACHRPFNPAGEEYARFCTRMLAAIEALPEIDFSAERKIFGHRAE